MKKKFTWILFVIILSLGTFVACSDTSINEIQGNQEEQNIVKDFEAEKIKIKKADVNNLNSKNLTEALNSKNGQEGIFCFTVSDTANPDIKKEFLLFNGVSKGFKDFDFTLEKNVLKIKSTVDPENPTKQELYFVERQASTPLDSIEVTLNKEDGSATIYEF